MGNRIRYEKQPQRENTMISVQEFVSTKTGARYRVIIDMEEKTYKIRNERTKTFTVISKAYGNMNVLKSKARLNLEKLGVQLNKEIRDRTFGQCEKGMTQDKWEKDNE